MRNPKVVWVSRLSLLALICSALACAALWGPRVTATSWRTLDEAMHHLGDDPTPEWSEAPAEPSRAPFVIEFESARANETEWLLELSARDADNEWALELNGAEFARLKKVNDELRSAFYPVPAGRIVRGKNTLAVRAVDQPNDDMTVGRVRLCEQSLRDVARLGKLVVSVSERGSGAALPARITVAGADGLAELYYAERPTSAVRAGIAYTSEGRAALELPAGRYEVWASRGMEWSAAHATVEVRQGQGGALALALAREVDTTGWVAADTHIHTLTHSGHGDASVEERLVTLAGEGIELAIATDHNHQTDYRPLQRALALSPWFTPVVGNEVTTDNGHMNAFPLDPAQPIPPHEETDWKKLVAGIRAKGAKVVILNHPRWPEEGKDPLTRFGFDERTGRNAAGQEFTFDCIELVNSDAPTSPPAMVLPAWFALLEAGQRFTGVGASDSHTVGVIVGQGRTYVPSASDDPARIDVDAACQAFLAGRVSVSLGMFATLTLDGQGMGASVAAPAGEVEAVLDVRHPSWVTPRKVELVVNGVVAETVRLDDGARGDTPVRKQRRLRLALPRASSWVVAVATGDKVTAPFWAMSLPEATAITNPIFVTR
jgi:hypothetical protein